MLKKTITYTDYNGVQRTQDFYFNLNKAEIMEMQLSTAGGLGEMLTKLIAAQDMPSLIKIFKDLILKSYGEKGPDGVHFVKSEALSTAFSQTEAFSELFTELATNAEAASAFVNGIVPAEISKQANQTKALPN